MAFRESETTNLLRSVLDLCEQERNPLIIRELVHKTREFLDRVPLYPGIVKACLAKVLRGSPPSTDIVPGAKVIARAEGKTFSGTVVSCEAGCLVLRDVALFQEVPRVQLAEAEVIHLINDRVLEEDWPSLIFSQETRHEG